jgi:hypothetical protein
MKKVRYRVTNQAGLYIIGDTTPVLYDVSHPVIGRVIDGPDFTDDQVWFSSPSTVTGIRHFLVSFPFFSGFFKSLHFCVQNRQVFSLYRLN